MTDWNAIEADATGIANALDADVLFLNGGIDPPLDHRFSDMCRKARRRTNVLLILVTPGGDAHTAYKIARCLQRCWNKITIFVPGWCKSAGTLLTIGAHELWIGDLGELGPIDVQRAKDDELWEMNSGLIEEEAFRALDRAALSMFGDYLMHIKEMSQGQVTFKTASDIATKMVVGQLQPVYAQIDPLKIGENARSMQVAHHYGLRLATHGGNVRDRARLESLVSSYSSHAFVIDRLEAEQIFRNVNVPSEEAERIAEALGHLALLPSEKLTLKFLSKVKEDEAASSNDDIARATAPDIDGSDPGRTTGGAQVDSPAETGVVRPIREGGEGEGEVKRA